MSYQGYLISNYATGYDRELQPWILPDDAYTELLDGYVYHGQTVKRDGYAGFATRKQSTYCESRMVHQVSAAAMTGNINGANKVFTLTATTPVRRGTFVVTGSNPAQTMTDDGVGGFTGDGTGTINYTTGAVSITLTAAPLAASTVTATYDYHQGLPVMGVMNFYPTNNVRELLVADTRYVNKYNPTTDRLDDLAAGSYNGTYNDFWSWVNYEDASSNPRLLFCNGVVGDVIQEYDGTNIANYAPTFSTGTLNAKQMFVFKDRLILFQTVEAGTLYPRRIRISGTGSNCDDFDDSVGGAGFIDIPDTTWFFGAAFNRDDILFFTETSTWALKFTGNDIKPFQLQKLDGSRGCGAPFSVISYLNRTMAASTRGLVITDGYKVSRMDESIPDFADNDVSGEHFTSCFSGFLDEERDVYMLYPSISDIRPALVEKYSSDRILVANFDEDTLSIYRIPLSCMGSFQGSSTVLWSTLTEDNGFDNWDSFAAQYGNWLSFPFDKGAPLSIGGGHKGEIWRLNDTNSQDNPQRIRSISIVNNQRIQVTTDWNNYEVGDYICFEDVGGMTEVDHRQAPIVSVDTDFTTFTVDFGQETDGFTAYTSGGTVSRSIPFEAITKKFNPWINGDKKLKCGWIYFYVDMADTLLEDAEGNEIPALLDVDVITSNNQDPSFTTTKFKYQINCSRTTKEQGDKKWVKIWINQVGQFLQFKMSNNQAGAKIVVNAMMPGFMPVGRLV